MVALLDSQVGDGKAAYEALISLAVAKFKLGLTTAELMDSFRDSLNASENETSISTVLESRPVIRSAKAVDLDSSYERLLGRTRIFTDIRPMFEDDAREQVSLASINHTLEIVYQSNGQDFDHFVTLDAGDLRKLRSQIDRALEKDENAQRFIAAAGASVLKQTEPTE
ncbi:hypothetical protein CH278_19665 [Rhodococcus sp. 05-2254-5]|nr:hypothetical protein CH278_19665 [Rhodococcus sp. 05-2254-5]OZE53781.1 hypothetical protein CH269_21960 [Rhodococcus sp. 05-2254-1]